MLKLTQTLQGPLKVCASSCLPVAPCYDGTLRGTRLSMYSVISCYLWNAPCLGLLHVVVNLGCYIILFLTVTYHYRTLYFSALEALFVLTRAKQPERRARKSEGRL